MSKIRSKTSAANRAGDTTDEIWIVPSDALSLEAARDGLGPKATRTTVAGLAAYQVTIVSAVVVDASFHNEVTRREVLVATHRGAYRIEASWMSSRNVARSAIFEAFLRSVALAHRE